MYSVIGSDGQVYGPVDIHTLQRWCQEGRLSPDTNLIDPNDGRVFAARHLPQLSGFFAQSAPFGSSPQGSLGPMTPGFNAPYASGYGQYPVNTGTSPKSKTIAVVLAFFLGMFGIHRFYLGHTQSGLAMLLVGVILPFVTCGLGGIVMTIWVIVDIVKLANNSLRDVDGRTLST